MSKELLSASTDLHRYRRSVATCKIYQKNDLAAGPSLVNRPCRPQHSSCNCYSVSALLLQRSCYRLCRRTCVTIAVTSTLSHPHIPLTIKMCLAVAQNFNGCNCTIIRYLICEDRTYTCALEPLLYFFSWKRDRHSLTIPNRETLLSGLYHLTITLSDLALLLSEPFLLFYLYFYFKQ